VAVARARRSLPREGIPLPPLSPPPPRPCENRTRERNAQDNPLPLPSPPFYAPPPRTAQEEPPLSSPAPVCARTGGARAQGHEPTFARKRGAGRYAPSLLPPSPSSRTRMECAGDPPPPILRPTPVAARPPNACSSPSGSIRHVCKEGESAPALHAWRGGAALPSPITRVPFAPPCLCGACERWGGGSQARNAGRRAKGTPPPPLCPRPPPLLRGPQRTPSPPGSPRMQREGEYPHFARVAKWGGLSPPLPFPCPLGNGGTSPPSRTRRRRASGVRARSQKWRGNPPHD
jgi:hypothetical protein